MAESSPHTLSEDWAILESVFASRNAITDLQNLARTTQSSSASSHESPGGAPSFEPGAHGRKLSSATGVDVPLVADVLPARKPQENKPKDDQLARRFSKRGVRLAVHSSILDLNAHDVPNSLKHKWISHIHARSPSIVQLGQIPEVDTMPSILERRVTTGDDLPSWTPEAKSKKRSLTLMSTPGARTLGKVISRLSNTGLTDETKKETKKEGMESKAGWSYRLTKPFVKPELTTPDFSKDHESAALR